MPHYFKRMAYIVQCDGKPMQYAQGYSESYLVFASEPTQFDTVEAAARAIIVSIETARRHGYESGWAICFGAVSIVPVEAKTPEWKFEP